MNTSTCICRRSLQVVNPSPYMIYLQAAGCILVASSPEILCRLDSSSIVTNRCGCCHLEVCCSRQQRRLQSSTYDICMLRTYAY